jgi:prepilin-type N-terminal cleavage/methylation domain-containing protein
MTTIRPETLFALLKLQHKRSQGFTLVEVLVGIILVLLFLAISMQAFVTATAFKVKAQELSDADEWIQADLEIIRKNAESLHASGSSFTPDRNACRAVPSGGTTVSSANGYGAVLANNILSSAPLSPNPTPANPINPVANTGTRNSEIGNRPYTLVRTLNPSNVKPYNALAVTYSVTDQSDNSVVATLYTELIPDASLTCPIQP